MKKFRWIVCGTQLLASSYGWSASSDHTNETHDLTRISVRGIQSVGGAVGSSSGSTANIVDAGIEGSSGNTSSGYVSANAGAGAGSSDNTTTEFSSGATSVSVAPITTMVEAINPPEPLKPSDLSIEQLFYYMGAGENGNTVINGHIIHGEEGFFSSLQGASSALYTIFKGLQPYMPFSKWVLVTPENKDALALPTDITADGKYAVQLAYFFPGIFNIHADPKKLIVLCKLEDFTLPATLIQPYESYKEELDRINIKIFFWSKIIANFHASQEDIKFFADFGLVLAQCHYAYGCYIGKWGSINFTEARKYFKASADQNFKVAEIMYAYMCHKGEGGPQDLETARKHYKLLADCTISDHAITGAQCNYAVMCQKGEGGLQDLEVARHYFKLAADQGHASAQYGYAFMCHKGEGGPQDLEASRHYLKLSADQRYPKAQDIFALVRRSGIDSLQNWEFKIDFNIPNVEKLEPWIFLREETRVSQRSCIIS